MIGYFFTFCPKIHEKSLKSRSWSILTVFRKTKGSNIVTAQFQVHIRNFLIKAIILEPLYGGGNGIAFLDFLIFSKNYLLCANKKAVFIGAKWHCFAIHIPWHGISCKNLEKVEHGAKWNVKMVRPGQVWSGQAMKSYLDLKMHINHSACYTEATYQISGQLGHRAQGNYKSP